MRNGWASVNPSMLTQPTAVGINQQYATVSKPWDMADEKLYYSIIVITIFCYSSTKKLCEIL